MSIIHYFYHTRERPDRKEIKMEWIEQVYRFPEHEQTQTDGRIKRWGFVKELNKYLRVIVLEDKETVHNAFMDRSYKKDKL